MGTPCSLGFLTDVIADLLSLHCLLRPSCAPHIPGDNSKSSAISWGVVTLLLPSIAASQEILDLTPHLGGSNHFSRAPPPAVRIFSTRRSQILSKSRPPLYRLDCHGSKGTSIARFTPVHRACGTPKLNKQNKTFPHHLLTLGACANGSCF
jgi:hypothetical protein